MLPEDEARRNDMKGAPVNCDKPAYRGATDDELDIIDKGVVFVKMMDLRYPKSIMKTKILISSKLAQ